MISEKMSTEYMKRNSDELSDLHISQFTEVDPQREAKELRRKLKAFYAVYDETKLDKGLEDIVNWTLRNSVDALNEKLTKKYGSNLDDSLITNTAKAKDAVKTSGLREVEGVKPAEKNADTKQVEPKKMEPKQVEPKKVEPKQVEPKKVEPKQDETKKVEPKQVETKKVEPTLVEYKKIEPTLVETKKMEPTLVETKRMDPKKAEAKMVELEKELPKEKSRGEIEKEDAERRTADAVHTEIAPHFEIQKKDSDPNTFQELDKPTTNLMLKEEKLVLTETEIDLTNELSDFFGIYDTARAGKDYSGLIRFVRDNGLQALNERLTKKYGFNLDTMQNPNDEDDNASLPSILQDMPPPSTGFVKKETTKVRFRSGVNPFLERQDDPRRLEMFARLSRFYRIYAKEKLKKGIGNIVDWSIEHGEVALNKRLKAKYGKDLTDIESPSSEVETAVRERKRATDGGRRVEEVTKEMAQPPQPKQMEEHEQEKQYVRGGEMSKQSGVNPSNGKRDDAARLELSTRITEFYSYFRKDKVSQGIGDVVDWAMEMGEEALNKQLRDKYGYDLNTFKEKQKKEEEQEKSRRETEELKTEVEITLLNMRERLIKFFKKYDPKRADRSLDLLIRYIEAKGLIALNKKLFAKYGADLDSLEREEGAKSETERQKLEMDRKRRSVNHKVPESIKEALERYYVKYNPAYLENNGIQTVFEWAQRNGMDALNKSLKEQHSESLDEFIEGANRLRDELIEFYKKADRLKLLTGLDEVLNWGLKNGRDALNRQLRKKYHYDLDIPEEEFDNYQSQSEQIF